MSNSLVVLGAGGHGRAVADVVRAAGYEFVGYADSDVGLIDSCPDSSGGNVIMGQDQVSAWLENSAHRFLALGIGDNRVRMSLGRKYEWERLLPLVHPQAHIASGVTLGHGCVIMPMALVHTDAVIGKAVIINSGAVIEHNSIISDGAHVSPGAVLAGGVLVGQMAWIGTNATILPGVKIGENAVVGAGSVVLRNVPAGETVAGNPARRLTSRTKR